MLETVKQGLGRLEGDLLGGETELGRFTGCVIGEHVSLDHERDIGVFRTEIACLGCETRLEGE